MSQELIGQTLLNRFRVDSFLAAGGMAVIYRVWDLQRSVPLAMKVLHPELADDPAFITRFQREAHSLELLDHPHIVPFYGLFRDGDLTFLLERYIDGPSLDEVLRRRAGRPLRLNEALVYFKALYTSLGYAHAQGIVHCDVKPGNVLIDQGGAVYLTDFGIARFAEGPGTTSAAIGTPLYMAPEQIRGEPVSPQTDIYGLGVLLFELLTGRRPFTGEVEVPPGVGSGTADRVRYQHLTQPPPDPRSLNPNLPPGVAGVILSALAKEPRQRYPSVQVMAGALSEAVAARFDTLPERVRLPDELRRGPAWEESASQVVPARPPTASPPPDTLAATPPRQRPLAWQPEPAWNQADARPPGAGAGPAIGAGSAIDAGKPNGARPWARWLAVLGVLAGLALCGAAGVGLLNLLRNGPPGFPGRMTATETVAALVELPATDTPVPTLTETPVPTLTETPTGTPTPTPTLTPSPTATDTPSGAGGPLQGEIVVVQRIDRRERLVLLSLADGRQVLLPEVPDVKVDLSHAPQWSPDGARLTWMSRYNGRLHIAALVMAEGEPYQLPAGQAYERVSSPAFLGDGQRISFWASDGGSDWLVIADAASGERLERIELPDYRNLFVWNWQTGLLAFARESGGQYDVGIGSAGGSSEQTVDAGGDEYAPAWSPDGAWLAFQTDAGREAGQNEIWIVRADGSGLRKVTDSPPGTWSRAPTWSPDGRWIAFVSDREGSLGADFGELFAVEVETGAVTRLTETGGGIYDWRPAWRP
ncbi:MAG: serine/threonine-protein kinase [Anaerolineaceae bacterium]|nr:serine/threonine-protein kinase [Anaerolineaceae bacterium]